MHCKCTYVNVSVPIISLYHYEMCAQIKSALSSVCVIQFSVKTLLLNVIL